jgi:predicted 2-oxoglutarate/Fe(II)-dependent dioxygenase YbiX
MDFTIKDNVLSADERQYLTNLIDKVDMPYYDTLSTLRNLYSYNQHPSEYNANDLHIINKLAKTAEAVYDVKLEICKHYFLRYVPGSSANMHMDDVSLSYVTSIVPLHISEDIEGGETCVYTKKGKKLVLPIDVGEVLFYGYRQKHSVDKLIKGSRLVLVSWFKRKEK